MSILVDFKPILNVIGVRPALSTSPSLVGEFQSMVSEIRKVDKKVYQSTVNKVDLHKLVTDVSMADTNLKILVAIRDSLMGAIQELTRMQI